MLYLSQLLGSPVEDAQGERAGKVIDMLVPIPALIVEGQDDQRWSVPVEALAWQTGTLRLLVPVEQLSLYSGERMPQTVSLAHDVLDKQVIDIQHKKAVRVNDVCIDESWQILGIDNSTLGLVRRLAPSWLLGARSKRTPASLIPWARIEFIDERGIEDETLPPEAGAELRVTHSQKLPRQQSGHLAELRPADIADIVHQLTPGQGARLIEGLDDERAADTLEEIDTARQSHILENIDPDRAASILAAMEPDEAADLLALLPAEQVQDLLRRMAPEESEEVQELLAYEEDSAGGLMTNACIALSSTRSVSEALDEIRASIREHEMRVSYVYCIVDEAQEDYRLLGVVSIWDLLVADAAQPLSELMKTDLVTVQPDADPRAVAEIMAKYNLLAIPVVSEGNILEGVVTVDDALDVLLPDEHRRKPTKMY